ncbi:MAG: glycosyltransferase family 1 protein [Clostridia bacterium]|nr:glycosyltransferase family 1 protein [Clostridia bacterium]
MIRVLQIVNSMDRGGIQTTLMNIFRNIDRTKVVLDFLLQTDKNCDYNKEILALGGRIYSITPRRKNLLRHKKDIEKFFNEHSEYNIVHMHVSSLTYIMPLKIAKKYKIPVRIIHSRNSKQGGSKKSKIVHYLIHRINKLFIKNIATDYFSCSDLAGKWLYSNKILNSNKYKIINNGIDSEKFVFSESKRKQMREQLKCDNKICIVNVGRFHKQKNHIFLIKVFQEIYKQDHNSMLYLIGEGSLRQELENEIKWLKMQDNIILLGKQKNVNDFLQAMDIFVMPSLYEGLPGSVIEAQGSGLPCLLSDTITKNVAITKLVNYMSLNSKPIEWANTINLLLKNIKRRNTREELIKSNFDIRDVAKEIEKFYIEKTKECENE